MSYGEIAYNAYCEARNWLSYNGDTLPHFKQQSGDLQKAWEKAGEAVAAEIRLRTGRG